MNSKFFSVLSLAVILAACCREQTVGTRCDALDQASWEASEWISAADAPIVTGPISGKNRRAADGASLFLSTVENPGKVVSAKWMTTGLGVFQLYLNGCPVGTDFLKPGFTHAQKTKIAYTYDVTDAFNKAAGAHNTLSAQVTPGWWADKIVTPSGHEGMLGHKCAFRAVLELTLEDGTRIVKGTNTTDWTAGIAGPVTHAGIFDGEEYDARIPAGFDTPDKLSTPEVNTEFPGEIVPTNGAEICLREDLALKPVQAYVYREVEGAIPDEAFGKVVKLREYQESMSLNPGETLVVDFGQNCAAVPCFEFRAPEGTVLTCLPAELLNDGNGALSRGMDGPEGSVHRTNLRIAQDCIILQYTFGNQKGFVSYMPQCTFFGYRFVSITATDEVNIRKIRSIPVTSITAEMETGHITTGDASINQIIEDYEP